MPRFKDPADRQRLVRMAMETQPEPAPPGLYAGTDTRGQYSIEGRSPGETMLLRTQAGLPEFDASGAVGGLENVAAKAARMGLLQKIRALLSRKRGGYMKRPRSEDMVSLPGELVDEIAMSQLQKGAGPASADDAVDLLLKGGKESPFTKPLKSHFADEPTKVLSIPDEIAIQEKVRGAMPKSYRVPPSPRSLAAQGAGVGLGIGAAGLGGYAMGRQSALDEVGVMDIEPPPPIEIEGLDFTVPPYYDNMSAEEIADDIMEKERQRPPVRKKRRKEHARRKK